jgi:type IV secretory pathway VirB4 component
LAKTQLSKEQIKAINNRMATLKKLNKDNKSSTQLAIPFLAIYPDGTCHIKNDLYSQTIEFKDCNYQLATYDDKDSIFSHWCDIHNYFDDNINFQFTYENQIINKENLIKDITIPEQDDDFNDIRSEYNEIRCNNLIGDKNGAEIKKYLTFTIKAKSLKSAITKLKSIQNEIIKLFDDFRVDANVLTGEERLEALYHSLNPFSSEPFVFDWKHKKKSGNSVKDYIAPMSLKFKKSEFEINNNYGSCLSINILAGELSDRILMDYLTDIDGLISVNLHIKPIDQVKALKLIRLKLTDVEKMKIDEQKKASTSGYDSDILPPSIKMYLEELNETLDDLNSKNERLYNVTLTIRSYATTQKKHKLLMETLKRITQKNSCKIFTLDYLQEQGFASSLVLGNNTVPIERTLQTSETAVFIPFATQEIFQRGGQFYGLNSVSKNMILGNRKKLKNPNGLYLGTPGSGKSFAVKREIVDVYFTTDDDLIITDPEGEYSPLVNHLNGQVVKISTSSEHHLNPMDVPLEYDVEDNPISTQSDFLISLCEVIISDKFGLTSEERTIIDRCSRKIYNRFYENPSKENMPMLQDLLNELREPDVIEIASRVANSLEMYVTGSQNLFNHRSNIDIDNRLVCFDIRDLGSQLKKVAMLIVQNQVWTRVSSNRNSSKSTRYYIDEFHLLLRDEQTARYSVEIWKRFRKWGGIPTGITQNVKDILSSPEIENILDNSDFLYLLNQASGDREILQEKLHISNAQIKYVTNSGAGKGLIFFGNTILPFEDEFPENTLMFQLLNTDPNKRIEAKIS